MDLTEIAASLTAEERAEAPRSWQPNGNDMLVRVIDPTWLRRLGLRRLGLLAPNEEISTAPAGPQKRVRPTKCTKGMSRGKA